MEQSLFQGRGSEQPVLTPLALTEHQARLQERVDRLQPQLRQALKEMEVSEDLQLRTQLFQWFCNDPTQLVESTANLTKKLHGK